jgi:hypothetical protein
MIGVVAHPELAPDDRRHPLGRPDIPTEPERFGAPRQQAGQFVPLVVRQFRTRARRHPAPQRFDTTLAGTPHPLAHGPGRDSEGPGNRLLRPVLLLQLPRPQPPAFAPVAGRPLFSRHTQNSRTSQTSFSNRHGDQ